MPKILLTAFEPFDKEKLNPSWEVARQFDFENFTLPNGETVEIIAECLPCVFGESLTVLQQALESHRPDIVISLGQAGGRSDITPECVAINLDDARIPDNAGNQPLGERILADGENAYFSTLPIKAIVRDLHAQGIPASVSYTAGTFVCNHVFYGLQHLCQAKGIVKSGFIHIPYLPEQAVKFKGQPSMAMATLVAGIKQVILTCVMVDTDVKTVSGETH